MGVGLGRTEHEGWCRDLADDKRRVGCLGWTEVVKRGGVGGDVLDVELTGHATRRLGATPLEPSEQILGVSGMVRVAVLGGTRNSRSARSGSGRNGARRPAIGGEVAKLAQRRRPQPRAHGQNLNRHHHRLDRIHRTPRRDPHRGALRGSTDQRTVGAEFGRCDDRALECCRSATLSISTWAAAKNVTEPQGDRTGDDGELQIEQIGNRTDGSADEPASPDAFGFVGRFGGTAVRAAMPVPLTSASNTPCTWVSRSVPSGSTTT